MISVFFLEQDKRIRASGLLLQGLMLVGLISLDGL